MSSQAINAAHGKAPPITNQTIMLAHLCLQLLRSASPANTDASVAMGDLKEALTSIAKARQWDGAEGLGTRMVYVVVGKKTCRIDRRGANAAGGRVQFAI